MSKNFILAMGWSKVILVNLQLTQKGNQTKGSTRPRKNNFCLLTNKGSISTILILIKIWLLQSIKNICILCNKPYIMYFMANMQSSHEDE